ncbi:hypothetical protein LIA77_10401 [Sarocladium implicatum]|jgi:hypothetical protein|nr:hypothetical protein LIA77_10401 [Sarocladium implicatum]
MEGKAVDASILAAGGRSQKSWRGAKAGESRPSGAKARSQGLFCVHVESWKRSGREVLKSGSWGWFAQECGRLLGSAEDAHQVRAEGKEYAIQAEDDKTKMDDQYPRGQ